MKNFEIGVYSWYTFGKKLIHVFVEVTADVKGHLLCQEPNDTFYMDCLITNQLSILPPFKGPAKQMSSQEDLESPVMHAGSTPANREALKLLDLIL